MGFLPIFIIGLLAGLGLGYALSEHKKETPSETRLKLLEAEIITLKSDNELLEKCIQKKEATIEKLKEDVAKNFEFKPFKPPKNE